MLFALSVLYFSLLSSHVDSLIIESAERNVDLSSQIARYSTLLTVKNDGSSSESSFSLISDQEDAVLSFILVKSGKHELKVVKKASSSHPNLIHLTVNLKVALQPGQVVSVNVEEVYAGAQKPFPAAISQAEDQLVVFKGNHYLLSPYLVKTQKTKFTLASKNVESYTKIKPSQLTDAILTLGPFENVAAYSSSQLSIHFENNTPFLRITELHRSVEVSHWGYISVEESIDVLHVGARLRGSFSRLDFQQERKSGISSVQSFRTSLPASAVGVYYRDDIGNISTSNMRAKLDEVQLELRPRFPLLGGWKTHYVIGYQVPVYQYLHHSGDQFALKMRLFDHVFNNVAVDRLTLSVALPEGSSDISLETPYPVERHQDSVLRTYLDTSGRPLISLSKQNLVDEHIKEFTLRYQFSSWLYIREPLMLVVAFMLVFLAFIVYTRLDFTISRDEGAISAERVTVLREKITNFHKARCEQYQKMEDAVATAKSSKDSSVLQTTMKSATSILKSDTAAVTSLIEELRSDVSGDLVERYNELQKLDKQLRELLSQHVTITEKLLTGKLSKTSYVDQDGQLNTKKKDTLQRIEALDLGL